MLGILIQEQPNDASNDVLFGQLCIIAVIGGLILLVIYFSKRNGRGF